MERSRSAADHLLQPSSLFCRRSNSVSDRSTSSLRSSVTGPTEESHRHLRRSIPNHHYPGTMGTKRQRPTNKVSTFRAPAPAAANAPAPPPDLVDIVARLDRIEARQQRIEASQQRIEASQERIETAIHQRFDELFCIMEAQNPQPSTP
ncbi:hypothetical protein KIW84_044065 [Lathyrus oleraceus]|uniref:Uncharacterized protein n=1 Tax=Pisum sativum TaxID=3888 RepID=A0A9D5AVI3_PEA|nr:hypothetical protein KIW84_044065 [Pisum sativum]